MQGASRSVTFDLPELEESHLYRPSLIPISVEHLGMRLLYRPGRQISEPFGN